MIWINTLHVRLYSDFGLDAKPFCNQYSLCGFWHILIHLHIIDPIKNNWIK